MARKITSGIVGGPVFGNLSTGTNTVSSVELNSDIIFDPNGTGLVNSKSDVLMSTEFGIRFGDADSSHYVKLKSPSVVASSIELTLPGALGTNGQIIQTNASGVLSFTDAGLPVNDRGAGDGNTYYPALASNIAQEQELKIASTLLSFVPNPGRLTSNYLTVSTDATVSRDLFVTNDVTVTQDLTAATITESSSIAYKDNVNPIANALDTILQLQGVTYDRKGTKHKGEAGLIAEEVSPILPNVVSYKDGKPEGINYTKLSAYLIEAVKELTQEIRNLKG
jgi:hypothetical protein